LWDKDPVTVGQILALLEQLEGDPDILDRLTQHDFGAYRTEDFHISKWYQLWNQGNDIWRLKLWDLEDKGLRYRVIYAFMPRQQNYHILAIAPREFNYDPEHPITKRILRAYQDL
jgi:hypothetical protein